MNPVYIFLPFVGAIIGGLIGSRAYKNYQLRKSKK